MKRWQCVARNIVPQVSSIGDLRKEGGGTERNVKFLTHLTEISKEGVLDPKPVACNNGAGGSTLYNAMYPIHLTEPQGIIKE